MQSINSIGLAVMSNRLLENPYLQVARFLGKEGIRGSEFLELSDQRISLNVFDLCMAINLRTHTLKFLMKKLKVCMRYSLKCSAIAISQICCCLIRRIFVSCSMMLRFDASIIHYRINSSNIGCL